MNDFKYKPHPKQLEFFNDPAPRQFYIGGQPPRAIYNWVMKYFLEGAKMKDNIVLYHGNCFDGMTAAYVASLALKDNADYIPVNYGEAPPGILYNAETRRQSIYILDFAYDKETLQNLYDRFRFMKVLDHHKTNEEACKGLDYCTFDMNKSGARLAWEYFFPNETSPLIVDYVEDRDLWRFNLPKSQEVNAFIQSHLMRLDTYKILGAFLQDENLFNQAIIKGEGIETYKSTMVDTMCKNARFITLGGYRVPVVNASILFSEVGQRLCELFPKSNFASYYFDRSEIIRQWGLRSIGEFDVSVIAKKYHGGGHKNAAGFETSVNWMGDKDGIFFGG